ncbi:hypothetical protein GCM10009623_32880 [Nocardioides aestuarii]|uniref:Uncharacterized protein n=1 Tax=Nocardioides aestuarii TaxID=252231 RepID=A0ABW4TR87_9ACTN
MPNFCVNKLAQPTGDHEVHDLTAGCSNLPAPSSRLALGNHASCHGAVRAATGHYRQVDGCYFCAPACHTR